MFALVGETRHFNTNQIVERGWRLDLPEKPRTIMKDLATILRRRLGTVSLYLFGKSNKKILFPELRFWEVLRPFTKELVVVLERLINFKSIGR